MTAKTLDDTVLTAPGFEPVREEFERLLAADDTFAGQFCAYAGGRIVADLWGGEGVGPDDLQGVFSSTKGAAAVCVALLVQRGVLDLDAPVARYWPEFAQAGKEAVTVRQALSHQAGLVGVEPQLTLEESMRHETMAARLAVQVPHWRPGAAHGYHALTIGTIIDELTRRITGMPVARMFREEIAQPRGVDFHIATPDDLEPRVKPILPLRLTPEQRAEGQAGLPAPDSLTGLALNAAVARSSAEPLVNLRPVRAAGQPAVSGTGSARGLARLYATCIAEVDGNPRLLSPETVETVTQLQTVGPDLVLMGFETRFAIVFEKATDRLWIGSHRAFGHDGAGGAIGVADPWHDLAYAWIPRRMTFPGGADERGLALARTVRACLAARRAGP
ncbi:MAG TPA: serine hydrolase domain-containing protein [Streptosporangiaceae bacterium]|nr:serine hydrolase domain-containing protein [Streptosporangiaceae bacterium]